MPVPLIRMLGSLKEGKSRPDTYLLAKYLLKKIEHIFSLDNGEYLMLLLQLYQSPAIEQSDDLD